MLMPPYRPAATARKGPGSYVVGPEGAPTAVFGAESFLNRAIFASRRGVPLKKLNFVWILLSFAPVLFPKGSPLDWTNRSRGLEKNSSKLSLRASLPRAFSPANGGVVQGSGAHIARRKTSTPPEQCSRRGKN